MVLAVTSSPTAGALVRATCARWGMSGRAVNSADNIAGHLQAFGGGADFVMLGGMLAGHDQSGGETVERNGRKYRLFYGMSSSTAMDKHHGGVAEYRASEGKVFGSKSCQCTLDDLMWPKVYCMVFNFRCIQERPWKCRIAATCKQPCWTFWADCVRLARIQVYSERSGCAFRDVIDCACVAGAAKLKDLPRRTTFIRVTQQTNEIFTPFET